MAYKNIYNYQSVNIKHHAIIEASAGTGKTYTIENLVIRLLKERKDIELEKILLVTFTEKATSELKFRIREKLESELKSSETIEITDKIKSTLDTFDTASIFTIHAFCQSILRDFAFENRMLFQSELVGDKELYDSLLKEMIRHWPRQYGDELAEMLGVSAFNRKKDGFLKDILDIAEKYRENAGDILIPELKGRSFQEVKDKIRETVFELKFLIGPDGRFSGGFGQLNINARARDNIQENIVIPLETYVSQLNDGNFDLRKLSELITQIQTIKSSKRKGVQCLIPENWLMAGENWEVCPNLRKIFETLETITNLLAFLEHFLTIRTVRELQAEAGRIKKNTGWLSFDDMLNLVEKALHGDNAEVLLKKLREKYKVAFVDEFQDTDPIQWKIFRKIFLDTDGENLLFLIGDPKQAIYAFRGADVYVYLSARKEMEKLAEKGQASLCSLEENWRSEPELIEVFNHLFCRAEWFGSPEQADSFEIAYQAVRYPLRKENDEQKNHDRSGRPALNIVDLTDAGKPRIAKQKLAVFIAREIRYLTKSVPSLDFGDMCILVRGKSEVPVIEKELSNLNIPYSYYKKPNLFLSDEALYLSAVFRAILNPADISKVRKALLTPFFQFEMEDLSAYEYLPSSHPVKQLFRQWEEYAESRKWSLLFQSLPEESGLLFRESESTDWDRKYTNYRQIFEHLEDTAYRKNLDFRGISALLDSYLQQSVYPGDDADIHQIETDEKKVRIMTMHVSKGLQFPVVFIGGGLTQKGGGNRYHVYHAPDENGMISGKIIDLSRQSGKEAFRREAEEENKRLFYVALTRAKHKLYLPYKEKERGIGPAGAMLAQAIENAFSPENENRNVLWLRPDIFHDVSASIEADGKTGKYPDDSGETSEIFPSGKDYRNRIIRLESFSSLHRRTSQTYEEEAFGFQTGSGKKENDDESRTIQGIIEKDEEEMPGGAEVGSMFHAILENIDFGAAETDDAEIREEISKQREIFRVDEKWDAAILRIIMNTLTTPIPFLEGGFRLSDLKKEDMLHEVGFYYPSFFSSDGRESLSECEAEKQYLRGWIDLIFRHNEKYYIADWKSNRIDEGYHQAALRESMVHEEYDLQYKIYAIALLYWLRQRMGESGPGRHFGGVFYFYLRGMGKGDEGIYHVSSDELETLEQLEKEIRGRCNIPVWNKQM